MREHEIDLLGVLWGQEVLAFASGVLGTGVDEQHLALALVWFVPVEGTG